MSRDDSPARDANGSETSREAFKRQYGRSIAAVFAGLVITHLPIINLIGLLPTFKEILLGAGVVFAFTSLTEPADGAKHAFVSGMTAAVVFNVLWIPGSALLGGSLAAIGGSTAADAVASGMLQGLGALTNLIGLLIFSPVGYAVGGVLGAVGN
ncbi:hypothetical protein [Haloplanus halophilus]|uniref:hypothetical protein n=1 Tax=Haloplanus halophilus TaxID=2949993 RepID=UPI0020408714|nr:hypothetical protein [Haloplanus sp. GDY1]